MSRVCVFVLTMTSALWAQFGAGVQGVVSDSSRAAAPGVTVTLTNEETGKTAETLSGPEGFYRFSGLAPGVYSISAAKTGFRTQTIQSIRLSAEQLHGQNLTLEPGEITQTVTVTGDPRFGHLESDDATRDAVLFLFF